MSVLGTASSAFAESPRAIQPPLSLRVLYRSLVQVADSDRDARVTRVELERLVERQVLAQAAERFHRLDRDANGRVTHSEVPKMDGARFARFDANGDGVFTERELAATVRTQAVKSCSRLIAQLDFDRDGAFGVADLGSDAEERVVALEPSLVAAASSEK